MNEPEGPVKPAPRGKGAGRTGRPVDATKIADIVDAGWTLFLARGVEAVSIETIAEAAGVAKGTVYKHFADKTAIFAAAIRREVERIEAAQRTPPSASADFRATLRGFGLGLMGFLFSDPAINFYNSLAGELRRHATLARLFYETGPGRTRAALAAILRDASARGELAIDDPYEAAEHLFGLWQGFSNLQLSLGIERAAIERSLERRIDRALDVFYAAYARKKKPVPKDRL